MGSILKVGCGAALVLAGAGLLACGDGAQSSNNEHPPEHAARKPARVSKPDSLGDAAKVLSERLDGPAPVPSDLPAEMRSAKMDVRGKGGRAQLGMVATDGSSLVIQYGAAGFDGCPPGKPRVLAVNGQPALSRSLRLSNGSPFATVIWPATPAEPSGRFGVSGTFSTQRIVRIAESMHPASGGKPSKAPSGC